MNAFHFLRPAWFLALPPLLVLLWLLWRRRLRSRGWQEVCDPELLPHLLLGRSLRRANWPLWLLLTGMLLAVLALAGPTWQKQPQPLFRQQSALVVLFDLSRSMNAGDLKPSRLVRARLKIQDILRQRREGQTALVAFAGDAFAVTPLTDDRHTIEALLGSLDPEVMPVQGSEPERALELGEELLRRAGLKEGTLLLVTDEDRPQRIEKAARALRRQGLQLAVLGVGTPEGAPIPMPDGGFLKDGEGNLVLPRLEESGLRDLAAAGGGAYRRISIDDGDFLALLSGLESHRLDRAQQATDRLGDRWKEAGGWLLLPLALLGAAAFRRGWLMALLLVLLLPPQARAMSWQDLWQRPDQRAHGSFQAGEYEAAGNRFEDPRWKSSALYRAGKYAEALKVLPEAKNADDWYNRGNALARSGQLSEALKAYDEALKRNPEEEDARANRTLVEQALKQQQQQQNQQQGKNSARKEKQGEKNPQKGDEGQKQDRRGQADGQGEKGASDQSESADRNGQRSQQAGRRDGEQPQGTDRSAADLDEAHRRKAKKPDDDPGQQMETRTDGKKESTEQEAQAAATAEPPENAGQREMKQWLQRIPDDPGGLLRRKFLYQYRQRGRQLETDRPW